MNPFAPNTVVRSADSSAKAAPLRRIVRGTLCCILFLATLFSTCAALRSGAPAQNVPVISEKLQRLAKIGGELDTLFIGSSRVYHQVDPATFDARMRELGQSTSSFNFGADGMNFPEVFYVLERALAAAPRLNLVVIELGAMQHGDHGGATLRSIYWRDLAHTWVTVKSIWRNPAGGTEPTHAWLDKLWKSFVLMGLNLANVGRGTESLERWIGISKKSSKVREISGRGFLPIQRQMSPPDLSVFRKRMKTKRPAADLPLRADPELRERLDALATTLRARGVRAVFFYCPAFRPDRSEVPSQGIAPVVDLDDPITYPEFFREELYYDPAHLNQAGSLPFTRALADEVQRSLK